MEMREEVEVGVGEEMGLGVSDATVKIERSFEAEL